MFAPESVFKKHTKLPKGFYHPSPYNDDHDLEEGREVPAPPVMKPQKRPLKINSDCLGEDDVPLCNKENSAGVSNKNVILKACASTSVDDLIKDIDEKLGSDPNFVRPSPDHLPDIENILSVSENSNTSEKVISPSSLKFYMDRFKSNKPRHPSTRVKEPLGVINDENKSSSSALTEEITGNSLSFDSSFLSKILSSDDSADWTFSTSNDTTVQPEEQAAPTAPSIGASFIEQLTGRSFSEMAKLVPQEVLTPSSDSEDILFQWRLRRKITDFKAATPPDLANRHLPPCLIRQDTTPSSPNHTDNLLFVKQSPPEPKPRPNELQQPEKCSIEIQTDAEKIESGCQVNISCDQFPLNKNLDTSDLDFQEALSDVSLSSISTDDLTNISQLEGSDIEDVEELEETRSTIERNVSTDTIQDFHSAQEFPEGGPRGAEMTEPEQIELVFDDQIAGDHQVQLEVTDQEDVAKCPIQAQGSPLTGEHREELLCYLQNIQESFDDELLNVFIEQYKSVLDEMALIEDEIKRRQHNEM